MLNKDGKRGPRVVLRLVRGAHGSGHHKRGVQLGLFPEHDPAVVSFFYASAFRDTTISDVIERLNPRFVVDVRAVPSFRALGVDRKEGLSLMEEKCVNYIDVSGMIGARKFLSMQLGDLTKYISSRMKASSDIRGPIVIILDSLDLLKGLAEELPHELVEYLGPTCRAEVFVGDR